MVGFIPDEIKYLSSLESLDVQNNHLVRVFGSNLIYFCLHQACLTIHLRLKYFRPL